jgi:ribosomal protein S18 acetylase RimI-like enzyme
MATIEAAETNDADAVVEMWIALAEGQRQYDSHIPAEPNRTQIREAVLRHITGNQLLLARDQQLCGFVMFTVEQGTFEQDVTRGIVENLYVSPDVRGQGIGTELLSRAERRLDTRGADAIALNVMATNEPARQFYRERGYSPQRLELEKPLEDS